MGHITADAYLDDRVLGSCRPAIFNIAVFIQFQTRFLLHRNANNWRCSIFGTSEIGDTPNLTSDSDSPSRIYPKTCQSGFNYLEVTKTGNVLFLEH